MIKKILSTTTILLTILFCSCQFINTEQQPIVFHVNYDANTATNGTIPNDVHDYVNGDIVTVANNSGNLIKIGSSFNGWNTLPDGSGVSYTQGSTFHIGEVNILLYASWTKMQTYTITYDSNGATSGIIPVDSTYYLTTQHAIVIGNNGNLNFPNYTFVGWNTKTNGSGEIYTQAQTLIIKTSNVILYAMWTKNITYKITYAASDADNGIVPIDTGNYFYGQASVILDNVNNLTKQNYLFSTWTDGITNYHAGQIYILTSNTTLYAQWNKTFAVVYDANTATGGTVPIDNKRYLPGSTITVLANSGNLTNDGYILSSWNTKQDGSGVSLTCDGYNLFSISNTDITLYAQWTKTFSVVYVLNGATSGTVPIDSGLYKLGDVTYVLDNIGQLSKTVLCDVLNDYWWETSTEVFIGWSTQSNGGGIFYAPNDKITINTSNVILYPAWSGTEGLQFTFNNIAKTYKINGYTGTAKVIYMPLFYKGYVVNELDAIFTNRDDIYYIYMPDNGIIAIKSYTCSNCNYLEKIHLPNSLISIGKNAFQSWKNQNLKQDLILPEGLLSIREYAFGNSRITSLSIPKSLDELGQYAFNNCQQLQNITFNNNDKMTSIDIGIFQGCTQLTTIDFPINLQSINNYAFYGCNLTGNLTFPASFSEINDCAFQNNYNLSNITFLINDNTCSSGLSIGFLAFCNSGITNIYFPNYNLDSAISRGIVIILQDHSLENCKSLISIDPFYGNIGNYVFYNDISLASLTVNICYYYTAFYIGNYAFANCNSLENLTFLFNWQLSKSIGVLDNSNPLLKINVPNSIIDWYKLYYWSDYASNFIGY